MFDNVLWLQANSNLPSCSVVSPSGDKASDWFKTVETVITRNNRHVFIRLAIYNMFKNGYWSLTTLMSFKFCQTSYRDTTTARTSRQMSQVGLDIRDDQWKGLGFDGKQGQAVRGVARDTARYAVRENCGLSGRFRRFS